MKTIKNDREALQALKALATAQRALRKAHAALDALDTRRAATDTTAEDIVAALVSLDNAIERTATAETITREISDALFVEDLRSILSTLSHDAKND